MRSQHDSQSMSPWEAPARNLTFRLRVNSCYSLRGKKLESRGVEGIGIAVPTVSTDLWEVTNGQESGS